MQKNGSQYTTAIWLPIASYNNNPECRLYCTTQTCWAVMADLLFINQNELIIWSSIYDEFVSKNPELLYFETENKLQLYAVDEAWLSVVCDKGKNYGSILRCTCLSKIVYNFKRVQFRVRCLDYLASLIKIFHQLFELKILKQWQCQTEYPQTAFPCSIKSQSIFQALIAVAVCDPTATHLSWPCWWSGGDWRSNYRIRMFLFPHRVLYSFCAV